ncbi:MAG: tetratricopeptide repeat protein [bacterium]
MWARLRAWFTGVFRRRSGKTGDASGASARRPVAAAARPVPDSEAFVKLAERYLGMQMADTALHVCQRGLEAHPEHLAGLALLARIYVAKGQRSEAQQLIERLLATHGDAAELAGLRGLLTSAASPSNAGEAVRAAPARPAMQDATRRELQALEGYLSRIRRELSRVGPG